MSIKTIDGNITKEVTLGDAVSASEAIIKNKALIASYTAKVEQLEAENTSLLAEAKKQTLSNLTDDDKKSLVVSGVKTPKDFPGDDWLVDYVVGENGV